MKAITPGSQLAQTKRNTHAVSSVAGSIETSVVDRCTVVSVDAVVEGLATMSTNRTSAEPIRTPDSDAFLRSTRMGPGETQQQEPWKPRSAFLTSIFQSFHRETDDPDGQM